jgi:predicted signal transduction protein with EAL and GGDEF domain
MAFVNWAAPIDGTTNATNMLINPGATFHKIVKYEDFMELHRIVKELALVVNKLELELNETRMALNEAHVEIQALLDLNKMREIDRANTQNNKK